MAKVELKSVDAKLLDGLLHLSHLSLALIYDVVFVVLSGASLLLCDLPIASPLRAVIRGHPTPGGCITMTGHNDIFRHGGHKLVLITGVDAEFEPIHLRPIG
jgi:hypothetical protein